ncbi:uncharacterized protein ARMOST_20119 [Armillaria ostoyae]|uniref:C2H2-type domain-containing protein n=2 Tax=Armillaria TaxID=47424 RepID=A0A284S6G1_ARMOS|nr:uncharacterized protein ARMOST_20119 [Armillaria ostoyae]
MADNEKVSLPSIQQWFPEHMLRVSPKIRVKGSAPPTLIPAHQYIPPQPFHKTSPDDARSFPVHTSSPSLHQQFSSDDRGEESNKHICTICHKRFRRPSSLNVHKNTHTGATPYQCSLPGCDKEFNVKSNMLRHYRTHTNSVPSQSYSSRYDLLTGNPFPIIHPSSDTSVLVTQGQDEASGQLQYHEPGTSHGSAPMEGERHYGRPYSMSYARSTRGGEEGR